MKIDLTMTDEDLLGTHDNLMGRVLFDPSLQLHVTEVKREILRRMSSGEVSLRKENDILRGMAATLMPCHYCGAESLNKCPKGFPGCSLADDLLSGEAEIATELKQLRETTVDQRRQLDAIHQLTHSGSVGVWLTNLLKYLPEEKDLQRLTEELALRCGLVVKKKDK